MKRAGPISWSLACMLTHGTGCERHSPVSYPPRAKWPLQAVIEQAEIKATPIGDLSHYLEKSLIPSEALWLYLGTDQTTYRSVDELVYVKDTFVINSCRSRIWLSEFQRGKYEFSCDPSGQQVTPDTLHKHRIFENALQDHLDIIFFPLLYYVISESRNEPDGMNLDDALTFLKIAYHATTGEGSLSPLPDEMLSFLNTSQSPRFHAIMSQVPPELRDQVVANIAKKLIDQFNASKTAPTTGRGESCSQSRQLLATIEKTIVYFDRYQPVIEAALSDMLDVAVDRLDDLDERSGCKDGFLKQDPDSRCKQLGATEYTLRQWLTAKPPPCTSPNGDVALGCINFEVYPEHLPLSCPPPTFFDEDYDPGRSNASTLELGIALYNMSVDPILVSHQAIIDIRLGPEAIGLFDPRTASWTRATFRRALNHDYTLSLPATLSRHVSLDPMSKVEVTVETDFFFDGVKALLASCLEPPTQQPLLVNLFEVAPDISPPPKGEALTEAEVRRLQKEYLKRRINHEVLCEHIDIVLRLTNSDGKTLTRSVFPTKSVGLTQDW